MKTSTISYQMSENDRKQQSLIDEKDHLITNKRRSLKIQRIIVYIITGALPINIRRSDNIFSIKNQVSH